MRRLLVIVFSICGIPNVAVTAPVVSDDTLTYRQTAQPGLEAIIARHTQWDRNCKPVEMPILKIDAPPKHGKIRADVTQFKPTRTVPGGRFTECLGTEMTGAALLYTADPQFSGQDEVTYTAIFTKRRKGAQKEFRYRVIVNVLQSNLTLPTKPTKTNTTEKSDDLTNRPSTQRRVTEEQATSKDGVETLAAKQAADLAAVQKSQGDLEQTQKHTNTAVVNLASKQSSDVKQIKEKQAAQDAVQGKLGEKQAQTDGEIRTLSAALGGIVLPAWGKPAEWMMRVAAVPVQQQQFCRIVDSFYDRLSDVYKTQNEIKRNALFRERKQDLAALLPGGNFENWVVQVVEVTQASDGSAAVMLQPPCRALMGSDACQRKGSEIRATIPKQSSTFRELERVNGGDFVVVSGKMLYADAARFEDPLPTYAVYEPGSHCSTSAKGRDADVFVTDVRYLVQLR